MAAVQQTVDTVKTLDVDAYKYGFYDRDRIRQGAQRAE